MKFGADDEPVEAVILDLAAPHTGEGRLEFLLDQCQVDRGAIAAFHLEIVDPRQFRAAGGRDLERILGDDAQPHMLQHGQHIGQRDGAAGVKQLQPHRVLGVLNAAIEIDAELLGGERGVEHVHVVDRRGWRRRIAIARRKCRTKAPEKVETRLLALALDERRLQAVGPGAPGLGKPRLDLG